MTGPIPAASVVTRVRNALLQFRYLIEFLTQPERRRLKALIVAGQLSSAEEIQAHLGSVIFAHSDLRSRARLRIQPSRRRTEAPGEKPAKAGKPDKPTKPRRKKKARARRARADETAAGPASPAPATVTTAARAATAAAPEPAPAQDSPATRIAKDAPPRAPKKPRSRARPKPKPDPEQPPIEELPAKLVGKVIDVETRRPIAQVAVRVIGTRFQGETETTGTFFWEDMPRGKQLNFELAHKEYRPQVVAFRSTIDDYQYLNVKLAPRETKYERRKRRMAEW